MLVIQPVSADVDDSHHGNLELVPAGRNLREKPADLLVVRAAIHKLVDDAVDANGAGHDKQLGVGRVAGMSAGLKRGVEGV